MARLFNYERADEYCASVQNTHVADLWEVMTLSRITPSVIARVIDVKTATVTGWLYGVSQPRNHRTIKRLEVITTQLEKAHEAGHFPRSKSIKEDDVGSWYVGESGYESVTTALMAIK